MITVPFQAVIEALLRERKYQDAKYGTIKTLTTGEWLLILEAELNEAKHAWVKGKGDTDALMEILQVAAVAVACLQERGVVERPRPTAFSQSPTDSIAQ